MPQDLYRRLLSDDFEIKSSNDDKRTFNGIANSGKVFSYYGVPTIVDFVKLSHKDKVPFLYVHDRKCTTGHGQLSVENNQLEVKGVLLTNEWGSKVAKDYDEDFPWQLSIDVRADKLDELAHGETALINGNEVSGPLIIMRQCSIVEVSFTPTGIDDQTHAAVLSDNIIASGKPSNQTEKETTMTLEEALAKIETLEGENKTLKEQNAELKAQEKQAKVDAELSQAGFSKDDNGKWQGISESTVGLLLSADEPNMKATIADLAKPQDTLPTDDDIPGALLGEMHQGNNSNNGTQLSSNPLVANAIALSQKQTSYI